MKKQKLDEHYQNYKIRKALRIIIMLLLLATIALSIGSLFFKLSFLYPLGSFLVASLLVRYRNSLECLDKKK